MSDQNVIGGEAAAQMPPARGNNIVTELNKTITRLTFQLAADVKEKKLNGQVLKVQTGRLRRSITAKTNITGDGIEGTVGTNVSYAARHEYGFQGTEVVKSYLRTAKTAWGKTLKKPVTYTVRSFTRKVNTPERSFLRSALDDMRDSIPTAIQATIERAANGT